MTKVLNYINGQFQPAFSGATLENIEPATGNVPYGQSPSERCPGYRTGVCGGKTSIWRLAAHHPGAAQCHFISHRRPYRREFRENSPRPNPATAENHCHWLKPWTSRERRVIFGFFAHALTQFSSEAHESVGTNSINFTLRHPIGVVGCISPWNLPLYLFTWKIAPALAAGNTVVAKPSELTPVTAFLLAELCQKAGLPAGVLNIVNGTGPSAGQAIVAPPQYQGHLIYWRHGYRSAYRPSRGAYV